MNDNLLGGKVAPLAEALEACRTASISPKPRRKRDPMTPWGALEGESVV
jgi:hypothetical protein